MAAFKTIGGAKFKEFLKKYGKVALGVHFSVSAASITGLYIAIKNNVDVESILHKVGVSAGKSTTDPPHQIPSQPQSHSQNDTFTMEQQHPQLQLERTAEIEEKERKRNRTAELAASSGGALALAVLCNKALFPIRVPITIALTPPVARFLARRKIIKKSV